MAWSGARKILLCLGLFVVASSFCSCTALTRLKALDKLRENSRHSQGQAEGSGLRHGRLFIGQNSLQGAGLKGIGSAKELLNLDADYQADMGWPQPKRAEGLPHLRPDNATVERLFKLEPKVECTGSSMRLRVQDDVATPGSLFLVDRGTRLSPLPLSKLPSSCGYTTRSTRRDFVMVAPYDGCYVALEEDCYVLPLRWSGIPVKMSCPMMKPSAPNPPTVTCHSEGMVVKTEWTISPNDIKVNLKGSWELLMKASAKCGFSVVVHPEGVVISIHYAPCLEEKDRMYTLELSGHGESTISCPSMSATPAEPTQIPPKDPEQQTKMPSKWVHHPTLPHNSGFAKDQTQSAQSAIPQAPDFPQNPEVPNQRPKDIDQPQLPSYPYSQFMYLYPDIKPKGTLQPLTSPLTEESKQTVPPSILPVAPEGQVPQSFFPFNRWPVQPEQVPVSTPPLQKPEEPPSSKPEHQEYKPLEPQPVLPALPVSQEQGYIPFHPYFWPQGPYKPQGPYQTDELPTEQTPTLAPKGQVKQPLNPSNPEMSKPKVPGNFSPSKPAQEKVEPTQPAAPMGPVHQYDYLPPVLPIKPTTVPEPEAPSGQHQFLYPYFYLQPENLPAEKPEHKPSNPLPSEIPGIGKHAEKPVPTEPPTAVKPPDGQVKYPFNYPEQPQLPQPVALPPATSTQTPRQVTIAQLINGHKIPQGPPPGSPYMPPIYCPQTCPSGFSNCCPQIAFHQHHHHIVPAALGSKDTPPVYPAMPLLHSMAYSGLGYGLAAPPSQEQTEGGTQASTTVVTSPQALPSENGKQPHLLPPDGNHEVPVFRKPANQMPGHPYFLPNPFLPQHLNLQNLQQFAPFKRPAPSNGPVNPEVQYVPYYMQSPEQQLLPGDMNRPYLMSFTGQYQQDPTAKELQPSSDSKQQMHPAGQSVVDRFLFPSLPPEEVFPKHNRYSSQPLSGSSKPTTHKQTVQPNSDFQSDVLLQHGPPAMEPNGYKKDVTHGNLKPPPQNLNPPQNRPQHPHRLGRMSNPLTANVNYIARPGDNSGSLPLFISARDGSRLMPLPQDPSFSAAQLKPEFLESLKGMWKPITPLGSDQRIPSRVPSSGFQQRSLAGHHQRD